MSSTNCPLHATEIDVTQVQILHWLLLPEVVEAFEQVREAASLDGSQAVEAVFKGIAPSAGPHTAAHPPALNTLHAQAASSKVAAQGVPR